MSWLEIIGGATAVLGVFLGSVTAIVKMAIDAHVRIVEAERASMKELVVRLLDDARRELDALRAQHADLEQRHRASTTKMREVVEPAVTALLAERSGGGK